MAERKRKVEIQYPTVRCEDAQSLLHYLSQIVNAVFWQR